MPVIWSRPLFKTIACRLVVYVMNEEILCFLGIVIELEVKSCDKIDSSAEIGTILVSHEPVEWKLKIVLDYGTLVNISKALPQLHKAIVSIIKLFLDSFPVIGQIRKTGNIPA